MKTDNRNNIIKSEIKDYLIKELIGKSINNLDEFESLNDGSHIAVICHSNGFYIFKKERGKYLLDKDRKTGETTISFDIKCLEWTVGVTGEYKTRLTIETIENNETIKDLKISGSYVVKKLPKEEEIPRFHKQTIEEEYGYIPTKEAA